MEFKCIITPTTPNPHNDISEDQHLLVLFAFLVLDPFTPSSQKFFFPSSLPRLQKKLYEAKGWCRCVVLRLSDPNEKIQQ